MPAIAEILRAVEEPFASRLGKSHVFVAEHVNFELLDNSSSSPLIVLPTIPGKRQIQKIATVKWTFYREWFIRMNDLYIPKFTCIM